jgi:hypothetical protein
MGILHGGIYAIWLFTACRAPANDAATFQKALPICPRSTFSARYETDCRRMADVTRGGRTVGMVECKVTMRRDGRTRHLNMMIRRPNGKE